MAVPAALLLAAMVSLVLASSAESRLQVATRSAIVTSDAADATLISLLNAETGVRGFVATGDPVLLEPWHRAAVALPPQLNVLVHRPQLTVAERRQLRSATSTELRLLRATLAAAPRGRTNGPGVTSKLRSGKDTMDGLREVVGTIQRRADMAVADRRADVNRLRGVSEWTGIAGIVLGLVGVAALYAFLRRVAIRINDVGRDARRLGLGEQLAAAPVAGDEVDRLSHELYQASQLLASRGGDVVQAHQGAAEAARGRARMLSRLSHEMRTPLTSILGYGQLLEASEKLDRDDAEKAEQVVRAGQHVISLLDELTDPITDEHKLTIPTAPTRLDELGREVCAMMRPLADERGITIGTAVAPDVVVCANRQRLAQVLINLVSNAIKYNHPGGVVTISARRTVRGFRAFVSDTGPGIRPEQLPRVFAPYERLDAAGSDIQGSGIGLALCRAYVEAMGGAIGVDSRPGEGARFWIELPAAGPSSDRPRNGGSERHLVQ